MTDIQLKHLIDDRKCYETIREMRWPAGTKCPTCGSGEIKKRGFHSRQAYRQRYVCHVCQQQFDDLTGSIRVDIVPAFGYWRKFVDKTVF